MIHLRPREHMDSMLDRSSCYSSSKQRHVICRRTSTGSALAYRLKEIIMSKVEEIEMMTYSIGEQIVFLHSFIPLIFNY